jgi:hypothetical protein
MMSDSIEQLIQGDDHAWAADHVASYVAAGLDMSDRLRMFRHLQVCGECRAAVDELTALDMEMRRLFAEVQPSPALETRTVQAVRGEPRPVRARVRRAAWTPQMKAMMVAAGVMLLIGVGAMLSGDLQFAESMALTARYNRKSEHGLVTARVLKGITPYENLNENNLRSIPNAQVAAGQIGGEPQSYFGAITKTDERTHSDWTGGNVGGKQPNLGLQHSMHGTTDQGRAYSDFGLGTGTMASNGQQLPDVTYYGIDKQINETSKFKEADSTKLREKASPLAMPPVLESSPASPGVDTRAGLQMWRDSDGKDAKGDKAPGGGPQVMFTPPPPPVVTSAPMPAPKIALPPPIPSMDVPPMQAPLSTTGGDPFANSLEGGRKADESKGSGGGGGEKKKVMEGNDKQSEAEVRFEIERRLGKFSTESDRPKKPTDTALPTLDIPDSGKSAGDKKEPEALDVAQAKKDPAAAQTSPPAAEPPLAVQHRKIIIRSGDMEFEIDSFDASVATIYRIISSVKDGFVATVNSEKLANGKMRGSVVVRMPPERLDDFVLELRKALAKTGDLKRQNIRSQDITEKYTDLESELRAHRTMETRLLGILKDGKGAVKDLLAVEKDLGVYREKIEKIEGSLRYYGNLAALSTLTIHLQEKEIRAAAAYTETERVSAGIEVEEVEKAYQTAQAAIREMKGRILQAEMKQQAAGQFNARLVFEISPDEAGPMRDRLRQLGNMVRLEMDRVQKIENGGEPTKVGNLDGKVRRGDTEFTVSLYNLANVEPRETTSMTLVAADVPAAYRKLRETLAKLKTTMRNASLQEQDKSKVEALVDFDVRRVDEPAAQLAIDAAGEILVRQSARQAEGANLTDAKVRFSLRMVSMSVIEPRETVHRLIAAPDVAAAYRRIQETLATKEVLGQVRSAALQQTDRNNVTAALDFVVRRSDDDAVRKLLDDLGETLTRKADRKLGDAVTDTKIRYEVTLIPETAVMPRDLVNARLAAVDVPTAYRKLRVLVEGLKGQIRGESSDTKDRLDVQAKLDLVVARADEAAVQAALDDLGEVLTRSTVRKEEGERVSNAKVEFAIDLVSAAKAIDPRKTLKIQMVVDKVEERMAEFDAGALKAGGRIVFGPVIDAKKDGGVFGEAIYDVPLSAADGLALKMRAAGSGERFAQTVTENGTAPQGKLAIARIHVVTGTADVMVPPSSGFDANFRKAMSVTLAGLSISASYLIAAVVFFLPWVLLIGGVMWVWRKLRGAPPAPTPATPPTV